MDLNLKGKRALVTGGSKGIGRACAEVLAQEGCTVLVTARNPQPGPNAKAIDLSQRGTAEALAAWAGDLDILAKNAGVIVNILGNAGEKLDASYIAGSTANAGLMAFTRALGGASHTDGVRVVGIN